MKAPLVLLALAGLLASCALSLDDPVPAGSATAEVDLRAWDFGRQGPAQPTTWAWDADVLWSPPAGRPEGLLAAQLLAGPETGGTLVRHLMRPYRPGEHGGVSVATVRVGFQVPSDRALGLRVGAFPGAQRVWANGVVVLERGVVSADPREYRADGFGGLVMVQPIAGRVDLVVELATDDPLVRHSEVGRLWALGSASLLAQAEHQERLWRALQATFLLTAGLLFVVFGATRREKLALVPFGAFLLVCLLKLLFNVEQAQPLLYFLTGSWGSRLYLFLNHGLNFVPMPLLVWFLVRQFPRDIGRNTLVVFTAATVVVELWELLPFVALSFGYDEAYSAVLRLAWSPILNLFTIATVLFLFERFYHVYRLRRPLSRSLFLGGLLLAIIILFPVILNQFIAVKFSYFLGWGLFLFLLLVATDLIRTDLRSTGQLVRDLTAKVEGLDALRRFVPPLWAVRLGRKSVEDLQPGDRRLTEAVVLRLTLELDPSQWLEVANRPATERQAILLAWSGTTATWVSDARPENALALAMEMQRALSELLAGREAPFSLVLTRAVIELRLVSAGAHWVLGADPLPLARLEALATQARDCGAQLLLDANLKDGLIVGGWRHHRLLSETGTEIELFEAESGPQHGLKVETLAGFEEALTLAAAGRREEAQQAMLAVVRANPLDTAARYFLKRWEA